MVYFWLTCIIPSQITMISQITNIQYTYICIKQIIHEKQALKKLENVRKDHEKRISALQTEQDADNLRAQLIEINLTLVSIMGVVHVVKVIQRHFFDNVGEV